MSDSKKRVSALLPEVLQTDVLRKFFAATADNLFQPEKVEYLNNYIGEKPSWYNPDTDFYVKEQSKLRQDYQVEPTAVGVSQDSGQVNQILFYEDLLNRLRFQGALTDDHNRLFEQEYYSFGLPCDIDMWLNFQNYVWLAEGPDTITLLSETDFNTVSTGGTYTYTGDYSLANAPTVVIDGSITPLVFSTGLKVRPSADLNVSLRSKELIVEGVGRKIYFVDDSTSAIRIFWDLPKEWDSTPWDGTDRYNEAAYIVLERGSQNQNPWSVRNRWFHVQVLETSGTELSDLYTNRAKRPIIQFTRETTLWNFGTRSRGRIDLVDKETRNLNELIGRPPVTGNTVLSIDTIPLDDGMIVLFTGLSDSAANNRLYQVSGLRSDQKLLLQLLPNGPDVTGAPVDGDSIYVAQGNPVGTYIDTYWRYASVSNSWVQAQSWKLNVKTQAPLFELYDTEGVSLSDPVNYRLSNFNGNTLFTYATDPTAPLDPILELNAVRDEGQSDDFVFNNTIVTESYTYQPSETRLDLEGFKFYRTLDSVTQAEKFCNNWFKSPVLSRQYVVNQSVAVEGQTKFAVDQTPSAGVPGPSTISVEVDGVTLVPSEYSVTGKEVVLKTATTSNQNVVIKTWNSIKNTVTNGYFEIPRNLESNPNNEEVQSVTRSSIINHLISIIANQSGITGEVVGINNWRDTAQDLALGTVVLQHRAPMLKLMILNAVNQTDALTSSTALLDPMAAMQWAQREYLRFYNKFITALINLYNGGGLTASTPIDDWVTRALNTINVGKTAASPWAMSGFDGTVGRYCSSPSTSPTWVPASAARLGAASSTIPTAFFDNTQPDQPLSLRCHNGALVVLKDFQGNDLGTIIEGAQSTTNPGNLTHPVARAWMQFEVNMYLNLPSKYRDSDGSKSFDITSIFSGKWRLTNYSRNDFLFLSYPIFERWVTQNQLDAFKNTTYEANDPFSWNYSACVDFDNQPVPGHWRGIYFYFFDTDRPHSHPWQMLGFSDKPNWWDSEYGPAPYTSGNTKMWFDIRDGRIAQGNRAGVYTTLSRPTLMQCLPVNEFGELLPPAIAGIVSRLPSVSEAKLDWKFGDRSPLENVWLTSVDSDLVLAQIGYLAKPAQFIEYLWDGPRAEQIYASQTNSQWIWSEYKKRVANSQFFVHRENPSEVTTLTSDATYYGSCGIQHWISEYLVNDNRNVTRYFGDVIRSSLARLGYRVGGFVDGTNIRVLADSFGLSTNDSLLLPQEDVTNNLIRSASIKEFFYSGVIVEYRGNNNWRVIGYDSSDPAFTIIPSNTTGSKTTVVIDKARVIEYKTGLNKTQRIPYGTVFSTQQEVYDFLVSLGRWQNSQGWMFTEYSSVTGKVNDWSLSAREFLFWSQGPWAAGTFIALSPLATSAKFKSSFGTIQNVGGIVNGTYSILDKGGRPIQPQNADFLRIDDEISVRPTNDQGIYGLRLYITSLEHALIFNNNTVFGDIIYDPLLSLRQSRFKLLCYRTMDWNGRVEAPGYMVTQSTQTIGDRTLVTNRIVANYEKSVDDIRKLYNIDVPTPYSYGNTTLTNNAISTQTQALDARTNALSKHLVGYQRREYLTNLLVDDTTQFQFYQGMITQKGTSSSIDKILRNTNLVDSDETFEYYEEFAFRAGTYGSNDLIHGFDLVLPQDQIRSNPQLIEIFDNTVNDFANDLTMNIIPGDPRIINKTQTTPTWALRDYFGSATSDLPTAGYVLFDEATYTVANDPELLALWTKLDEQAIPITSRQRIWKFIDNSRGWEIYRVCQPTWKIASTASSGAGTNTTTVTTTAPHGLQAGTPVVIYNVTGGSAGVSGTYLVNNPETLSFEIDAFSSSTGTGGNVLIYQSVRYSNYSEFLNAKIPGGWTQDDLAYVDGTRDTPWKVYKKFGSWFELRRENNKVDTNLLLSSTLYNRTTLSTLAHLTVWDPAKGIVPGVVSEEVVYRTTWDPASYNAGDASLYQVDPATAWGPIQVGVTWWDLSTTRFIDYEIGTDSYRRQHWGQVAPGISIDIYEWIRSTVPPSAWAGAVVANNSAATGGGVPPTGQIKAPNYPYVLRSEKNSSGQYTNVYYFWVKNKTTVPDVSWRKTSVSVLAQAVQYPQNQNISWWAAISSTGALVGNINSFLNGSNTVWQANHTSKTNVDKIYKQWTLLRPNDPLSTPTAELWTRMCASLLDFDATGNSVPNLRLPERMRQGTMIRPSQSWFTNSNSARKTFVTTVNSLLSSATIPPADDPDRTNWRTSFDSSEPQPAQKNIKTAVRVATTEALDSTYWPGDGGKGASLRYAGTTYAQLTIDGISVEVGDRILVKNQTPASISNTIVKVSPAQNGIYEVVDTGSSDGDGRPWILVRATDFDSVEDNLVNAQVTVQEGASNLLPRPYRQINSNISQLGSDPVLWERGLAPSTWDYHVANLAERDALIPSLISGNKVLVDTSSSTNNRWTIWTYDGVEFVLTRMQAWNTQLCWQLVDWYAEGYSSSTTITYTVDTLQERDALTGLKDGDTVRVNNTGNNRWNLFNYSTTAEDLFTTVGVQNGGIELSDNLYDYAKYSMGFDGGSYASEYQGWEFDTRLELSYILQGLWPLGEGNTGLLKVSTTENERNRVFFDMVYSVLADQTFVDWCFKTSFISLKGFNQKLMQTAYYNPSKIDNLESYIKEIKPYHALIRQFIDFRTSDDEWTSDGTDFDKPPYESTDGNVRILDVNNPIDLSILSTNKLYKNWYQNYLSSNSTPLETKTLVGNGLIRRVALENPVTWQYVLVRRDNLQTGDWSINSEDPTIVDLDFTPNIGEIVTVDVLSTNNLTVRTTRTRLLFDRLACVPADDYYAPGLNAETPVSRIVDTIPEMLLIPASSLGNGDIVKVKHDDVNLWSWYQWNNLEFALVAYENTNGAANRISASYLPTANMPSADNPLLISGCAPKGTVLDGLDFNLNGRWGEPVWDGVLGYDNSSQETDRLFDQYISGGQAPKYWVFKGDGTTTAFGLPEPPQAPNDLRVWVDGVVKAPGSEWIVRNWVTNVQVANQGVGYNVNDLLTVQGGSFGAPALLRVTNTSALGNILDLEVEFPGSYTLTPSGTAVTCSGGSGVNATFVLRWGGTSLEFTVAPGVPVARPNIWVAEAGSTFESPLGGTLDAVYDGLGLSRPHVEGGHPEELMPITSRETILIDVATQPSPGFGNVIVESWDGDGTTDRFFVGQPIFNENDVIVTVGGTLKNLGPTNDYVFDASSNSVVFLFAPTGIVNITSFGFGGATPGLGNWNVVTPGIDYNLNDTISLTHPSVTESNVTVLVTAIKATGYYLTVPGQGYAVGDLLYFKYGSGAQTLVIEVTSIQDIGGIAGQVSGVTILNAGYYTQPSISTDEWYTNGSGTGVRITPRWGVAAINPIYRGSYLVDPVPLEQTSVTTNIGGAGIGTGFSLGNLQSHIQEIKTVVSDGVSTLILMDQSIGTNTVIVTWNGVPTVSFGISPTNNKLIGLGFLPASGDTVTVVVYSSQYQSLFRTQQLSIALPTLTYPLTVNTSTINPLIGFNPALSQNAMVYKWGKKLSAPYVIYSIGNGATTEYTLAFSPSIGSDIRVWVNATQLTVAEWSIAGAVLSLVTAPAIGAKISIQVADPVAQNYDYLVEEITGGFNIVFSSWAVANGDQIVVKTFGEDSTASFVKDIWGGNSTNSYQFTNTPLDFTSIQVYLNGAMLSWVWDYTVELVAQDFVLNLAKRFNLTGSDVIEAYYPIALPSRPAVAFRNFTNIYNETQYQRLSNQARTVLSKELKWDDTEIYVADGTVLLEPTDKRPGVIWLEGERIEYFDKAPSAASNYPAQHVLRKFNRGTLGTPTGVSDKFLSEHWSGTGDGILYPISIIDTGEYLAVGAIAYVFVDGEQTNDFTIAVDPPNAAQGLYLEFPATQPPSAGNNNITMKLFRSDWTTTDQSYPVNTPVRDGTQRQTIPGGYKWPYGALGIQYSSTYQTEFLLKEPGTIPV